MESLVQPLSTTLQPAGHYGWIEGCWLVLNPLGSRSFLQITRFAPGWAVAFERFPT
jgi:hypothetical protein